jgi:hypothetical protein
MVDEVAMLDGLSSQLLEDIAATREIPENATPARRAEIEDLYRHFDTVIIPELLGPRETLVSGDFTVSEKFEEQNRQSSERFLDEHYTIAGLKSVGSLVDRTMKLTRLRATATPSKQTNRYISEASRAYIYGFSMASVAMSRAALEQGLKERLALQNSGQFLELKWLILEASKWNLLSKTGQEAARDLARRGNDVIHEKPTESEASAFEILTGVRSLLEEIYSSAGSY